MNAILKAADMADYGRRPTLLSYGAAVLFLLWYLSHARYSQI